MILIIKRIDETALVADIENFVIPTLRGGLFSKSGRLENISIQMIREKGKPEV